MQLCRTKFQKSFILSTKKWIKCFPGINSVDSRVKSGDITGGREGRGREREEGKEGGRKREGRREGGRGRGRKGGRR